MRRAGGACVEFMSHHHMLGDQARLVSTICVWHSGGKKQARLE